MNPTNLIVYIEGDEISFNFVTDSCFNDISQEFSNISGGLNGGDDFCKFVAEQLNDALNQTHPNIFMQTFCLEQVNMPAIKNMLFLPQF